MGRNRAEVPSARSDVALAFGRGSGSCLGARDTGRFGGGLRTQLSSPAPLAGPGAGGRRPDWHRVSCRRRRGCG
jgi:hypothetical protein